MNFILQLDQYLTLALNGSESLYVDHLAWTATKTATWIPLALLLLYLIIRNNNLKGVLSILLAIGVTVLLADQMSSAICKPLVARFRPSQDPYIMYSIDVVKGYRGALYGFFSSHASNTMALATLISLMVRDKMLTIFLYSWALLSCWTRAYLGVHYVGDLLVGTLWGIFVGWAIFKLWLKYTPGMIEKRQLIGQRANFTAGGYSIGSVHLLISGLAVTYLFIAFKALF